MVDSKMDRRANAGQREGGRATCRPPAALPPCQATCPVGLDIPGYVRLIAQGKPAEALSVILQKLPFPSICGRVCPRPCEAACNLGKIDEPVMINALKRFAVEYAPGGIEEPPPAKSSGKSVAVVGSGPAGLTAAYYLARLGHRVTVFEAAPRAGGLLRTGIPRYHLPGEVLDGEIARLERLGVEFRLKHPVLKLAQLFRMGYDAVFLGIGLTQGRMLPIPGRELEGVLTGLSFLRSVSLGQAVSLGDRVLVMGGGGVACDVARTALRMGAAQVSLACLESREQMPALPWEVAEAEKEGVTLYPGRTFVRILGENHVTGVECRRLSWMKFDENGKLQMEVIEGSEHVLEADTVIFATGQAADLGIVAGNDEIKITGRGTIEVDPGTLATGRRHVFAGGDIVSGQTVINAIAAGRKAAVAIDKDLGGRGIIGPAAVPAREAVAALPPSLPVGERGLMPLAPVAERLNSFMEVELGLAAEMAATQAQRCLRCDLPITITPANCTGCRICEFRCSLSHGDGFNLSRARIKVRRLVGAENEYDVAITEECDDCGICVRYCPYRALTRSREEQEA